MFTDLEAFASGFQRSKDFAQQIAAATLKALQELDGEKISRLKPITSTISKNDWEKSDNVNFPYYCDIPAQDVTADDLAIVFIDMGSASKDNGFYTLSETAGGSVRIRAEQTPTENLPVTIWILKGV